MYRSKDKEYELIQKAEHIAQVEELIERNCINCFEIVLDTSADTKSGEDLANLWNTKFSRLPDRKKDRSGAIRSFFAKKIEEYEKEAEKYRSAFNEDVFDGFMHDENAFKGYLTKECPVITHSFHARAEELREWQILYAKTPSLELFSIFNNLIQFANEYADSYDESVYKQYANSEDFGFDEIEDECYGILGVIGMGIKATTIYHLYPNIFPRRGKLDLFGLYFLTDRCDFRLPTKTSEFIMVNDKAHGSEGTYKVDHNYWYPYELFAAYAMKIYRRIADYCEIQGTPLDPHYRYVYINAFLEGIAHRHKADIQTLTRSSNPQYAMSQF